MHSGCRKCNDLYQAVKRVAVGIPEEIEISKIEDMQEILKYGLLNLPGVVVDGEVVVQGKIPDDKELLEILIKHQN